MSDDSPAQKRCPKCGCTKPFDVFYRDKSKKDGRHSYCKPCDVEASRAWRAVNVEYLRDYEAANAEGTREYNRAYYLANAEARREYSRAYRAANANATREYSRAYHAAHADELREYYRAYRAAHPEIYRAQWHRRRARLKGNGGSVTAHQLAAKRASQHGLCFYCRMPHAPDDLTIDHVIPLDQGGPHIIANIVFACAICNSSKRNRTPEQWTNRWYERKK